MLHLIVQSITARATNSKIESIYPPVNGLHNFEFKYSNVILPTIGKPSPTSDIKVSQTKYTNITRKRIQSNVLLLATPVYFIVKIWSFSILLA